jgi:arabinose-5-phosphate isomerase
MSDGSDVLTLGAADVMTRNPITIHRNMLAAQALLLMEQRKITSLIVAGPEGAVEGVLHLHDLWRTELF